MGPGHLLTSQEVKLGQQLHLTPHVQLAMAEGGAGSWPKRLEGLRSSGDPGMMAGKGQALPSGQPPFSLGSACLALEPWHLLDSPPRPFREAGYHFGLVTTLGAQLSVARYLRHCLRQCLHP